MTVQVHGVDVEGKQLGIDEDLVALLGRCSPVPVTYAGGARTLARPITLLSSCLTVPVCTTRCPIPMHTSASTAFVDLCFERIP